MSTGTRCVWSSVVVICASNADQEPARSTFINPFVLLELNLKLANYEHSDSDSDSDLLIPVSANLIHGYAGTAPPAVSCQDSY